MSDPDAPTVSRQSFSSRHIGPDDSDQARMLSLLGYASRRDLIDAAVPAGIRDSDDPDVVPGPVGAAGGQGCSETEALDLLGAMAAQNQVLTSMIGQGYHDTITPPVILRNVLENPGWYTAYTPYQPEISQGRLEALLNFQTVISDLTGLALTNASLLDEATAAAEAMAMCSRLTPEGGRTFFVDADCHPQVVAVLQTRAEPLGLEVLVGDPATEMTGGDHFGVLLAYPGSSGTVRDLRPLVESVHGSGGLVVVTADLLALTLLSPPGEWGADIVVGSAQRFGVPLGFGGPHAAFMATSEQHKRVIPGRIVGVSVDTRGRRGLRLALQTREQHIRREKATSNICTAQVLLANIAGAYAVWHGPDGLRAIAERVHHRACTLASGLESGGFEVVTPAWFDTISVRVPGRAGDVVGAARQRGINLRHVDQDTVGISCDEVTTADHIESVWSAFDVDLDHDTVASTAASCLPPGLERLTPFLEHPVFARHRSETEMLRYLRHLCDQDLALDRTMIPLGSCTMKLNATAEMVPITWPGFARIHPFAPVDQTRGYQRLIADLEAWLCQVTGYHAVSLQPNAGSQGEYAGLLAIRAYHQSRGEHQRDVCLIPSSAHGTNPASAAMAGLRVVVVRCDDAGNVDLADLEARIAEHRDSLAALMVTYPSTHGVFEEAIGAICELVHEAGGQVYLDGANLNALVGLARPGAFGADVSHLNLHKTFCIPHGGGGPGVGPVAVRSHLAPFLPSTALAPGAGQAGGDAGGVTAGGDAGGVTAGGDAGGVTAGGDAGGVTAGVGPVSAAPWGSAGILPITWMYLTLMGLAGLRAATEVAILNANYIARRLEDSYPVLYTGGAGLVAHECILDLRPLRDVGISVDDVAKRLMDYGFHAPTMSFPVAGTLMIEPTESEPLAELDRFCDAMIAIRTEIDRVASGEWPADDNPLVNAPHPAEDLLTEDWAHPYARELAAYPLPHLRSAKYWPPVSRIDASAGDRNLVCSCPPVSDWAP